MRFEGKVAIVTGGGTGIGKAVAEALVREGAKVVLNGRREDVLVSTATAIGQGKGAVARMSPEIFRTRRRLTLLWARRPSASAVLTCCSTMPEFLRRNLF